MAKKKSERPTSVTDEIGHFTTIPNYLIEILPIVGRDAYVLFGYLRYRTNRKLRTAFPGYDRIRSDTTLTFGRISAAIKSLEAAGFMERRKRFGDSTQYYLKVPSLAKASSPPSPRGLASHQSSTPQRPVLRQVEASPLDVVRLTRLRIPRLRVRERATLRAPLIPPPLFLNQSLLIKGHTVSFRRRVRGRRSWLRSLTLRNGKRF